MVDLPEQDRPVSQTTRPAWPWRKARCAGVTRPEVQKMLWLLCSESAVRRG